MVNGSAPTELAGPLASLWRSVYKKAASLAETRAGELLRDHVYLFHRTTGGAVEDIWVDEAGDLMYGTLDFEGAAVDVGGAVRITSPTAPTTLGRIQGADSPAFPPTPGTVQDECGVRFTVGAGGPVTLVAVRWFRASDTVTVPGSVRLWDTTTTAAPVWSTTSLAGWAVPGVGWKEETVPGGDRPVLDAGGTYALSYTRPGFSSSPQQRVDPYVPVPDAVPGLTFETHCEGLAAGAYPSYAITGAMGIDGAFLEAAASSAPATVGAIRLPNGEFGRIGWRTGTGTGDNWLGVDEDDVLRYNGSPLGGGGATGVTITGDDGIAVTESPADTFALATQVSADADNRLELRGDGLYGDAAATDHTHPQVTTGEYHFQTNPAMTDPGTGNFRSNTGAAATATSLAMDQQGAGGTDITTLFQAMRTADTVFVQDKNDASRWVRYQLTAGPTINTGWAQVPVSVIGSGGTIAGSQLCVMQLTLTAGGGGGGGGGSLATDPLADAKGDVFAASGNDAIGRLPVGTNGHVLTADSTQTLGVRWAAAGGGSSAPPWTTADQPPAAPDARNVEGTASALPSGWALAASSGTPTQQSAALWADTAPSAPSWNLNADVPGALVLQPLLSNRLRLDRAFGPASGTKWAVAAKVRLNSANADDDRVAFVLSTAALASGSDEPANGVLLQFRRFGVGYELRRYHFNGGGATGVQSIGHPSTTAYLAFTGKASNQIDGWASDDGLAWNQVGTWTGLAVNGNPAYLSLVSSDAGGSGTPALALVHWVRLLTGDNNLWKLGSGL